MDSGENLGVGGFVVTSGRKALVESTLVGDIPEICPAMNNRNECARTEEHVHVIVSEYGELFGVVFAEVGKIRPRL